MSHPDYVITKNCKHRNRLCAKCGFALKFGRKYSLDPARIENGLPLIYHKECFKQMKK